MISEPIKNPFNKASECVTDAVRPTSSTHVIYTWKPTWEGMSPVIGRIDDTLRVKGLPYMRNFG